MAGKYEGIYRVQLWFEGAWKWGIHDYTKEEAEQHVKRMKTMGIKSRVKPLAELFS